MLSIPLYLNDLSLELALPFAGWPLALRWLLLLFLPFATLAVLLGLARYELRLVPLRIAITLLALRVAVFVCILLTLFLEPKFSRTIREEVPGRVLIAIDRSESMRIGDPQRPLLDKLILAKSLNWFTDLLPESLLDRWIQDVRTRGEPLFSEEDTDAGRDERKAFAALIERYDRVTRLSVANRVLQPDGAGLLPSLQAKHAVQLIAFDQSLKALPSDAEKLGEALEVNRAYSPESSANHAYTDLKLPLLRAAEIGGDSANSERAKLLGVVVLTDGRHNWGESPLAKAMELGQRKVPIFSIVVAPREAPADVALLSAQAQSATVFKGSTVPIETKVRITGWPAGEVRVKVEVPPNEKGELVLLEEIIHHNGLDQTYSLSFKVKLDAPGPQSIVVVAQGEGAKDRFPNNNKRIVRVNVVKDRARVMLIDGEARWEFHYLQTCLGRDPNMDVRSVVFRQPRITRATDEELRKFGTPASKMPTDADALSGIDCIVLGDVEPEQFSLAERQRLEKYVAEDGGTLVMLAGKRAMPMAYTVAESEPFRKMMPLNNLKVLNNTDKGFSLNLTPEARASWFLQLGDTPTENAEAWAGFPPHYWAITGEPKPGAEVLATANGSPVLARQNYGFGRVFYVGIDSTWRWRYKTGDYYHHRFWGQVAQWAASDRLLPTMNAAGTIKFGTREPAFRTGQEVEVIVRGTDAVKKLGANTLKGARVVKLPEKAGEAEKPIGLVPLKLPENRTRDLVGKLRDLLPGKYALELSIPEWTGDLQGPPGIDGRALPLRSTFEVLPPEQEELVEISANVPLLEDFANASSGKVYWPHETQELIERLARQSAFIEHRVERPFRKSWWLLGLILLLLSAEWGLRKWSGLP